MRKTKTTSTQRPAARAQSGWYAAQQVLFEHWKEKEKAAKK